MCNINDTTDKLNETLLCINLAILILMEFAASFRSGNGRKSNEFGALRGVILEVVAQIAVFWLLLGMTVDDSLSCNNHTDSVVSNGNNSSCFLETKSSRSFITRPCVCLILHIVVRPMLEYAHSDVPSLAYLSV